MNRYPPPLRVRLYLLPNGDIQGAGGWVTSPEGDHYEVRWTSPAGEPIYAIPYATARRVAKEEGWLVWDETQHKLVLDAPQSVQETGCREGDR